MIEKLGELNTALEADHFRDLIVTCTRTDPFPQVMFRTYATNAGGGADLASISVEATGRQPATFGWCGGSRLPNGDAGTSAWVVFRHWFPAG